jgi:hypothetical protein
MPLRLTYANQLNDPLLAANSINTFTGPQSMIKTTANAAYVAQPLIIPAAYLKPGTAIRTEAFGTFTNTATTPTLSFSIGWGSNSATVIAVSGAIAETSSPGIAPWHLYATTVVRSAAVPSAVVLATHGFVMRGTSVSAITTDPIPAATWATVNVDNSAAAEWGVYATLGTSAAANIVVCNAIIIEEVTQA